MARFTDRELDIMTVLWERGPSTVAEVQKALHDPLAYTTVLTVLRVLEDKEVRRVGSEAPTRVDVRLIAASNKDLRREVSGGNFREDLFYRVSLVAITLPPLRERVADIELLARHFLHLFSRELNKDIREISEEALNLLRAHRWPGNIRELRNVMERAAIFAPRGTVLRATHLPAYLRQEAPAPDGPGSASSLTEMEQLHIQRVLQLCKGNRARAAEILQISPVTLWRKLKGDPPK